MPFDKDLDQLDMAVIRMAAPGPAPLTFARRPAPVTDIMTIGYPATPDELACIDPERGLAGLSTLPVRRVARAVSAATATPRPPPEPPPT